MTLSQLDYFGRAARLEDIEYYKALLGITHNPYSKTNHDARKLMQSYKIEENELKRPGLIGGKRREPGVPMSQLRRAFGPIPRKVVTQEEWEKIKAEKEAARERGRALMAERLAAKTGKQDGGAE